MSDYIIRDFDSISVVYSFRSGRYYPIRYEQIKNCSTGISDDFLENNRLKRSEVDVGMFNSPLVIGIMYVNACNLDCSYCIAKNGRGYSEKNILSENSEQLITALTKSKIIGALVSGGEPTINVKIGNFLEALSNKDLFITIDSNGVKWSDSLFSTVVNHNNIIPRISLDANSAEIHNKNRGGFEATVNTISRLSELGKTFRINTVLHRDNIDHLKELADFLYDKKIGYWHIYKLQSAFASERLRVCDDEAEDCINSLRDYVGGRIKIFCKFTGNNDGFASFMMDSEGNLFSTENCSKMKVIFGNIFDKPVENIWLSTTKEYRQRHIDKFLFYK